MWLRHLCSVLLLLYSTINSVKSSSVTLTKTYIEDSSAVCVDGSQASYYVRRNVSSSRWVIYVEDGYIGCLGDKDNCLESLSEWPYFSTSDDEYHPQNVEATTIFSDDPVVSPWPGYNYMYINYCSQDGWLGRSESLVHGVYVRGSSILKAALSEALNGTNRIGADLVVVGSGAGALGVFNHQEWLVNSLGFNVDQLSIVLDSYLSPVTQTQPSKVLVDTLPVVAVDYEPATVLWVDGQPCALVYHCMRSVGRIPTGVKTLIISSAFDAPVFAFPSSAYTDITLEVKDIESITELVAQYVAYAGSLVQAATNLHYDRVRSNCTVFIAGCLHHAYITPIDPSRRNSRPKTVPAGLGRWKRSTDLDRFARVSSVAGPFRWFRANFPGSSSEYGARMNPVQYPSGATLGEMVGIWARSSIPDIAGDLCADTLQCGEYCNNEELTAARVPMREQFFRRLGYASASVFVVVLVVVALLLLTDGVHRRCDEHERRDDDKYDLLHTYVAQRRAKRLLEENDDDLAGDVDASTGIRRTRSSGILLAREAMTNTFGKKKFTKHQTHSGSNENKKLMNLLQKMDGHSALCWSGLRYHSTIGGPAIISGSWGRLRYGRVTGILGRGIALVQREGETALVPHMTAEDNLYYRASLFASLRHSAETIHKHVDSVLERCGLFSCKYTQVYTSPTIVPDKVTDKNIQVTRLTDGQRRRLLIGLELLANDSILFLDDPTGGLDASASLEVMTVVQNEAMMQGKCVVVAMHQPRNELFELLDDLLLMKGGKTMFCGSAFDFKAFIYDQLEESAYDSTSDRIVDHLEVHRDLFVPNYWNEESITVKMVKVDVVSKIDRSSQLVVPRNDKDYLDKHGDSIQFDRISDMFVQFCSAIKDNNGEYEFIPSEIVCELYADALQRVTALDIVRQVNFVLTQHKSSDDEYVRVGVNVVQRGALYLFRRWLMKIAVIIRRLWLAHDSVFYLGTFGLTVLVYPLMALLLMDGIGVNDLFLGLCFISFFPFFILTLVIPSYMTDSYRRISGELGEGVYGAIATQFSFVGFYTFISICVALAVNFSIFIVREHTGFWEVYKGFMILNMDMFFAASLMYLCTLIFNADSKTVFFVSTMILVVQTLLSGLFIRIHKFPDALKAVMQINPMFITIASFQQFYIGSCGMDYGDEKFCRNAILLLFGYEPYNEPSYGLFLLIIWAVLVNILSLLIAALRRCASPGVYVSGLESSHHSPSSSTRSKSMNYNPDSQYREDDPDYQSNSTNNMVNGMRNSELENGLTPVQEEESLVQEDSIHEENQNFQKTMDGESQNEDDCKMPDSYEYGNEVHLGDSRSGLEMINGGMEPSLSDTCSEVGNDHDDMSPLSSQDNPSPKSEASLLTHDSVAMFDAIEASQNDEDAVVIENDLFTCTQTVHSTGHGFAELCILIRFHQTVESKKDIVLGLSESQMSMSISLVQSPEEEETLTLIHMIDSGTIKSKFSNSTLKVCAATISFH